MMQITVSGQINSLRFFAISTLWLLQFFMIQGGWSLRDVRLRAPHAVLAGDTLSLSCAFALEPGERLYSVKFYQGDTEFYRYVPGQSPSTRVFALDGLAVDVSRSNGSSVTLRDAHRDMTGHYKCEVSADEPLFHTGIQSVFVTVTEEPSFPVLTAEKSKYVLGETIRANCTAQGGYPPANLTWYLNGRKVFGASSDARVQYEVVQLDGVDTAALRLELEASPPVFRDGRLRVRCIATQFTFYRRSAELELHEELPQLEPVLGPAAPLQPPSPTPHPGANRGVQISSVSSLLMITAVALSCSRRRPAGLLCFSDYCYWS